MGFKNIDTTPPYMRDDIVRENKFFNVLKNLFSEHDVLQSYLSRGELYWHKLLHEPLNKKELALYFYGITAVLTAIMYFFHTLFQSHGFFSFIGHVISGTIVGVLTGVLWPIVLFFNSSNAWAIIFTLIASVMILYRLKFYTMYEKKYFYIFSGVYGLITLLLLIRYFNM